MKLSITPNCLLQICLYLLFLGICNRGDSQISPLPLAHSHNDYERDNPLHDALANGFTSIEADERLWATPEEEAFWSILLKAGIGLINTDDLSRLRKFLLKIEY